MKLDVTDLPGLGVRRDFATDTGRRVGVVALRDGTIDLIVSRQDDPDGCLASLHLSHDEAIALGSLLGMPQVVNKLMEEQTHLPSVSTTDIPIASGTPYAGRTLGDTQMRTRTGVSIVAVLRDGEVHASPGPTFRFEQGDMVVVVGTPTGTESARALLASG